MKLLAQALAVAFALVVGACYDPAHHDAVELLGPEATGVPAGPTHRPGQPCTTCHSGKGPADLELSVAGTVYQVRGSNTPLPDAKVIVTDAVGDSRTLVTNAVGNFFISTGDWDPWFPLTVALEAAGAKKKMVTRVGRDGSCAHCHRDAGDSSYMPGVFLKDTAP